MLAVVSQNVTRHDYYELTKHRFYDDPDLMIWVQPASRSYCCVLGYKKLNDDYHKCGIS